MAWWYIFIPMKVSNLLENKCKKGRKTFLMTLTKRKKSSFRLSFKRKILPTSITSKSTVPLAEVESSSFLPLASWLTNNAFMEFRATALSFSGFRKELGTPLFKSSRQRVRTTSNIYKKFHFSTCAWIIASMIWRNIKLWSLLVEKSIISSKNGSTVLAFIIIRSQ